MKRDCRPRRVSPWTEDACDYLRTHYKEQPGAELAAHFGISVNALRMKAYKMGLHKSEHPTKIRLTIEQRNWLRREFPHMSNEICAMHLGISVSSTIRFARELGVRKTDEFMRECLARTLKKAKESHLRNGTYPPKGIVNANLAKGAKHRFKPGHKSYRKSKRHEQAD